MRLNMEISGGDELHAELVAIGKRAADARPAFRAVLGDFFEGERRLFDAQGAGEWEPLKRRTVQAKSRAGLDTRILHASGHLRDSLTGGAGGVKRISAGRLTMGTALFYARFQSRPPLVVSDQDHQRWAETVRNYVATGEVRGGLGL